MPDLRTSRIVTARPGESLLWDEQPEPEPFDPVADAREILRSAIEEYDPPKVFALFSGGHDSRVAAEFASECERFAGCVHINTTIGVEETREYVRETCRAKGWPLIEIYPPKSYEQLVIEKGFPGPGFHPRMYQRLKERCLWTLLREQLPRACRDCGEPEKGHGAPRSRQRPRDHAYRSNLLMLVSGIRRQESTRRMLIPVVNQASHISARIRFSAPLINWGSEDKNRFIAERGIERNPVVERLCMSGECLCGAFAKPNEIDEIALWYPETAARIREIEAKCRAAGVHAVWGTAPPAPQDDEDLRPGEFDMFLCYSCNAKQAAMEDGSLDLVTRRPR